MFDIFEESKTNRKITAKHREFKEQTLTPKILEKTQIKSIVYAELTKLKIQQGKGTQSRQVMRQFLM